MSDEKRTPVGVPESGEARCIPISIGMIPRRLVDAKTDAEVLQWAQDRVLVVVNEHGDPDDRANALLAFGIMMGFAIRGMR